MQEHNRLRLARLSARYAVRVGDRAAIGEAEMLREFEDLRERVLRPHMEELAAELRRAGHEPRVVVDEGPSLPSIELALGLAGARAKRNVVGFAAIRWSGYPVQILAYLEVNPPPFDIERFSRAADLTPERVEQLLVDAVEHIMTSSP